MNTLQFTNVVLSLLSSYFFLVVIRKKEKLSGGLDKEVFKSKGVSLTYVVPTSILLFACSLAISMWGEYGLYAVQAFSFLGVLEMLSSTLKKEKVEKTDELDLLKVKVESLEFCVSFITKNYLTESKEATRRNEDLKTVLDGVEVEIGNLAYDVTVEFTELRKKLSELEENQTKSQRSIVILQGEVNAVDLKLKDNINEVKDDYKREVLDLSENIKALNEAIADLKAVLKPIESKETKAVEPKKYMDPYIKAYLEG